MIRIVNKLNESFKKIRSSQANNKLVTEGNKELFVHSTTAFLQKFSNIYRKKVKKNLGLCFGQLLNVSGQQRLRSSENSESCVSPYRVNSRIDHSERLDSELDFGQSQGYDKSENTVRENKFLKKKKEKIKNQQN